MKFGRNVVKEETTQKKNYQDEDKKSAINKKLILNYCRLINAKFFLYIYIKYMISKHIL